MAVSFLGPIRAGLAATTGPAKTRPVVAITYPAVNGSVSNAVLTVAGKATGNVAVASVHYRLNTNDWALATTTNNWTNWTASVTLTPGPNTLRAYAVDTSNNPSLTNTVKFTCALYAPLAVPITGQGTVSPSYGGKPLQIGKSYTMTAMPGKGFKFTGWTGSTNATTAKLTFQMESNLTFTANFLDVQRPVLAILFPKANQNVGTAALTVSGKASDNAGVVSVLSQLNGGGWNPATTTNNWTNWTAGMTLTAGMNTFEAYALDAAGNASLTNTVHCTYGSGGGQGDLAPSSISGLTALIKAHSSFSITFGAQTFTDTMLPGANEDQNSVGGYVYTKLSPTTALLAVLKTAPPGNAHSTSNILALTFTASNRATCPTNADGTVGPVTVSFSQAANTCPHSLAGKTMRAASAQGGGSTVVLSDGTFSSTTTSGEAESGTYTFDQYSPVGGLAVVSWTAPADMAGSVAYMVMTFSSASAGHYYSERYDASGTESSTDSGTFTLQ
jgi:uncharacterized repeat protein (TIGR02543 family)